MIGLSKLTDLGFVGIFSLVSGRISSRPKLLKTDEALGPLGEEGGLGIYGIVGIVIGSEDYPPKSIPEGLVGMFICPQISEITNKK